MAANGSGGGGWLWKGLGCMALVALLCCCGGAVSIMAFPQFFLGYLLSDTPLPGPSTERKPLVGAVERAAACAMLLTTGEADLPPELVARWVVEKADPSLRVLRVDAQGDQASVELSVATEEAPPRYLNLQLDLAFTLQKGWFTDFRAARVVVRDHDWSSFVAGQQLAQQVNQSLANERAQKAELGPALDSVRLMKVEDGELHVELEPGSPLLERMCGAR